MNFMKNFMGGSSKQQAARLPLASAPTSVGQLAFRHSTTRWHGDSRTDTCAILVHDVLNSADSWSPFIRAAGQLPTQPASTENDALTVKEPVEWFAVELPFHQKSISAGSALQWSPSFVEMSAERVVQFFKTQIVAGNAAGVTKVHLVGHGVGANVCAMAALNLQDESVASVTMIDPRSNVSAAMVEKLKLLSQALESHNQTIQGLDLALKASIPNEWERVQLIRNVVLSDEPNNKRLVLRPAATVDVFSKWNFSWPAMEAANGESPVFRGRSAILSSSAVEVDGTKPNNNRDLVGLMQLFPDAERKQVAFQFTGDETDVSVAVQIVDAMGLLGTVPIQTPPEP